MIWIYHMCTSLVFALALPFLPLVWIFSEKRRANLVQRLGFRTGLGARLNPSSLEPGPRIWVHALSVGEVNSALPFVKQLRAKRPAARIIFTTSTRTGFQTAKNLMQGKKPLADELGYFPFDLWFAVRRVTAQIHPDLVCLVETDLWPGFLSMMKAKKIPVVLVNARLSPRSLKGYLKLGPLSRLFFSGLSHVMAQTDTDAARFRQVGLDDDRISIVGNIKFDQSRPVLESVGLEGIRRGLGIREGQPVWVAGSTHEGEETQIMETFAALKARQPDLKLVMAPRDPDRSAGLAKGKLPQGMTAALFSDPADAKIGADILMIDRLGELLNAYAVADLAFVGGSLVSQGGHNPLEPAMFEKPVLFGLHMTDFHEVAELLTAAGGAWQVAGVTELTARAGDLLADPVRCRAMGRAAGKVFETHAGAVERTIEIMEGLRFV